MTGPTIPPSGGKGIFAQKATYPAPRPTPRPVETVDESVNIGDKDTVRVTNSSISCDIYTNQRHITYNLKISPANDYIELTVSDSISDRGKRKTVTVDYTYDSKKIQEQLEKFLSHLEKAHQNAKKTETKEFLNKIITRISEKETTVRYHKQIFEDQIKE